jgi:hypothetical protein
MVGTAGQRLNEGEGDGGRQNGKRKHPISEHDCPSLAARLFGLAPL